MRLVVVLEFAVRLCSTAQLLNKAASPRSSWKLTLNSGSAARRSKVGSTRLVVLEGEAEALDRLVALGISMLLAGLLEQHLPPASLAGGAARSGVPRRYRSSVEASPPVAASAFT